MTNRRATSHQGGEAELRVDDPPLDCSRFFADRTCVEQTESHDAAAAATRNCLDGRRAYVAVAVTTVARSTYLAIVPPITQRQRTGRDDDRYYPRSFGFGRGSATAALLDVPACSLTNIVLDVNSVFIRSYTSN